MHRERPIVVNPKYGGLECPNLRQTVRCNTDPCPSLDCQTGDFGAWSQCNATCGGGWQNRSRPVIRPPLNGGNCITVEFQPCQSFPCPTDCNVSAWTEWTNCSRSCGGGIQHRFR
jgi:hypothetical protein